MSSQQKETLAGIDNWQLTQLETFVRVSWTNVFTAKITEADVLSETGKLAWWEADRGSRSQVTMQSLILSFKMLPRIFKKFYIFVTTEAKCSMRWLRCLRWSIARAQVRLSGLWDCDNSENAAILSPGWIEKAAKMEEEAQARISEIKQQNILWILLKEKEIKNETNQTERKI